MKDTPVLFMEKTECTGCSACASFCAQNAITMQEDQEGFLYPIIDAKKCVNCRKCVRICPMKAIEKIQKENAEAVIITLYYHNYNYGGIAQSYALYKALQKVGIQAELLSYKRENQNGKNIRGSLIDKIKRNTVGGIWRRYTRKGKEKIEKQIGKKYEKRLEKRKKLLDTFMNQIPHTKVLMKEQIPEYVQKYSLLISGGDQIWRPGIADEAFLFHGVERSTNQKIISYASSVGVDVFSEEYLAFMENELKKYSYISVREGIAARAFSELLGRTVDRVVDPTLLLKREEWEEITAKRLIKESYIFCYLIGNNKEQRKAVVDMARREKKLLVTLPHIQGGNRFSFRIEDWHFGDRQMFAVGMEEFFSLIKYADFVMTDSFHATVFSILFQKEFIVFEKDASCKENRTTSRIYELASMSGLETRIWKKGKSIPKTPIDYRNVEKYLNVYIEKSWEYLYEAYKDLEKGIEK